MRKFAFVAVLSMLAFSTGCGRLGLHAAESGDSATLQRELAGPHKAGRVSDGEARKIALKVARRELSLAKGDVAIARIKDLRSCARDVDGELHDLEDKRDRAGALAALVRYEMGTLSRGSARDYLDDKDGDYRGVGAHTLSRGDDGQRRRQAMVDPNPIVRKGAMRAAEEARDPEDFDVLFESARVDPDPFVRTSALRAFSWLTGSRGPKGTATPVGEKVALKLRDLWVVGDDALREDIAVTYAISPVFESGGRDALRLLLAKERGPGQLAGAGALVRRGKARTGDLYDAALGVLGRSLDNAPRRDRLHAIGLVPLVPELLPALQKVANDADPEARVAARTRLLEHAPSAAAAKADLLAFTAQKADRALALRARYALASAGEVQIQAWIEADLGAPDAATKLAAATDLAALGRPARAVMLLGDPDAHVRTRAACIILTATR